MRYLIGLIVLFICVQANTQIDFVPGYFIDNDNNKVKGFIRDADWKNNPTKFSFKRSLDSKKEEKDISEVSEFGIDNISKYVRSETNLDRSTNNLNKLKWNKHPEFKKETLFLKALVEGDADLYMYEADNLRRYFYRVEEDAFEQLVYKKYRSTHSIGVRENNRFRQQLINSLKCNYTKAPIFTKTTYTRKSLIKIFKTYNSCTGGVVKDHDVVVKRDLFNIDLKGGIGLSFLTLDHELDLDVYTKFPATFTYSVGVEAELILPFGNNTWSAVVDPSFTKFRASQINREKDVIYDYLALDFPIGLRYNHFFNDENRVFVTTSYSANVAVNSTIAYRGSLTRRISPKFSPVFSVGYKKKDSVSVELQYAYRRNLLSHIPTWQTYYSRLNLMFGYNVL